MLTLLSPAKKLVLPASDTNLQTSQPLLLDQARALSKTTQQLTRAQIKQMMQLSDNLTDLTFERFQAIDFTDETSGTPAALTFAGDVYQGLQAQSLTPDDLAFAQNHIRILSGLYGLLRPLDRMQPYR
ncbi:MAG: YaaA family protein, partial [Robiginitomaculum sp.]|nr:YaaA family protein [Robiginitomaculum sp.]